MSKYTLTYDKTHEEEYQGYRKYLRDMNNSLAIEFFSIAIAAMLLIKSLMEGINHYNNFALREEYFLGAVISFLVILGMSMSSRSRIEEKNKWITFWNQVMRIQKIYTTNPKLVEKYITNGKLKLTDEIMAAIEEDAKHLH